MIKLFEHDALTFTTQGLGSLKEALSCVVVEELNGEFELEMEYPIKGLRYDDLELRRIIVAKPNGYSDYQPFRIYSISKPIKGIVTVRAEHISYDLSYEPLEPFSVKDGTMQTVLNTMVNKRVLGSSNFNFETYNIDIIKDVELATPMSIRKFLGSVLHDAFKPEYEFRGFTVSAWKSRGQDRGVKIEYGKNLTDLTQEENNREIYTGVYPFYQTGEDTFITLTEKYLEKDNTLPYKKIEPLDLSQKFDEMPTEEELRAAAIEYMEDEKFGVPKVSLKVSFVHLAQDKEYEHLKVLEAVHLGDTVTVSFPELKVETKAKCVGISYDAIAKKYIKIAIGDPAKDLASSITDERNDIHDSMENQNGVIGTLPTKNFVEQAALDASKMITGNKGGFVVLHSSTGSNYPDELLITDNLDLELAMNVWRWNSSGLGFSSTGYADEAGYTVLALTNDGKINANAITAGSLNAIDIHGSNITGSTIVGGVIKGGSSENVDFTISTVTTPTGLTSVAMYSGGLNTLPRLYSSGEGVGSTVANRIYVGSDGIGAAHSVESSTKYTSVMGAGVLTVSGNSGALGDNYKQIKVAPWGLDFVYHGNTNPANTSNAGTKHATIQFNSTPTNRNCLLGDFRILRCRELTPAYDIDVDVGSLTYKFRNLYLSGDAYISGWIDAPYIQDASIYTSYIYNLVGITPFNSTTNIGNSGGFGRFQTIYLSTAPNVSSDEGLKNTVIIPDGRHDAMFDALQPIMYKLNSGTSGRHHAGFGARAVEQAVISAGLTTKDFAGICIEKFEDGSEEYSLRYEEFISLCVDQIQKLKKRVEYLEGGKNK